MRRAERGAIPCGCRARTIDDTSGGQWSPACVHGRIGATTMERAIKGGGDGRRARATAHELARYEALFAARTHEMKSSAMREMMALTERPDVISLAGGLPDTTTFEPALYARLMAQVAAESTARALQYGPTEGMTVAVECVVEVMAEEGTVVDPTEV